MAVKVIHIINKPHKKNMNVQELIEKLQEVKDKSLKVTAPDDNSCTFLEVIGATENLEEVFLTIKRI